MKEFLFIVCDIHEESNKFFKVVANDEEEAKDKFAKAFFPYIEFNYDDLEYMLNGQDVKLYYIEINNIITLA